MAIIGKEPIPRCTAEEWVEFRGLVSHGMLFEVIEWLDAEKPTLRPKGKTTSAFESALLAPNLSMTQVLWERAWQDEWEVHRALSSLCTEKRSTVVLRYLLGAGCSVDGVTGYDLCLTHDLELIRLGMRCGVDILEPDGWASAFISIGSRPLIRFYLEERDRIPGLRKDAVYAMCECIKESRLRALALLSWAGVDPLGKAPRYDHWDEPEETWKGFPALYIGYAAKPDEILKLLKLKPTVSQWFQLVTALTYDGGKFLDDVLGMMPDPMALMRRNPAKSGKLLSGVLQTICWGCSWSCQRDERLMDFCVTLLDEGVRLFWRDNDEINRFRREIYRTEKKDQILQVLKRAAEVAGPSEKKELMLLVNKPKMRELVIQRQPIIMELLGLLPPSVFQSWARRDRRFRSLVPPRSQPDEPIQEPESAELPNRSADLRPERRSKPPRKKPHEIKRGSFKVLERKQIHADVWANPATHVAAIYGISGSMLARICTKLQIPRPPRGYWARSTTWRNKHKKRLSSWKGEGEGYWAINPANVKGQRSLRE